MSYDARLHNLVSVRIPDEDEEAGGGPRERHIAADNAPPWNRPLLDDGLCGLVRVTALVQRAACKCDACWCCELPANALVLPLYILV